MLLWMPGFTASWHDAKTISSFLLIYIWALNYYEAISADVEARYDTCIYLRSLQARNESLIYPGLESGSFRASPLGYPTFPIIWHCSLSVSILCTQVLHLNTHKASQNSQLQRCQIQLITLHACLKLKTIQLTKVCHTPTKRRIRRILTGNSKCFCFRNENLRFSLFPSSLECISGVFMIIKFLSRIIRKCCQREYHYHVQSVLIYPAAFSFD